MLNPLFVVVALASVLFAAYSGQMQALTDAILRSASDAVTLAIGLIGVMAFFLGLFKVGEDAGLMYHLARLVGPPMRVLFPTVPAGHPAMSAMLLNISANMLGLGNAATPFGIRAMEELDKLNARKGTATNAMVMFLALNTSGLAILPSGMVGLRVSLGSQDATGIFFPTWFASGCATTVAIIAAALLSRQSRYRATEPPPMAATEVTLAPPTGPAAETALEEPDAWPRPIAWRTWVGRAVWLLLLLLVGRHVWTQRFEQPLGDITRSVMSFWMLPAIVVALVLYGWVRGIAVYDSLVEGAKQGFQVALRIIPYLVAILVVVGMFRASGGLGLLVGLLDPVTSLIGLPAEALPMAILRPLTGQGAFGVAAEAMKTHGPDSLIGYMVSTFQGSTETTFYVLAVYFGAVGIKETRHTLPACLLADVAGILAAVFIVNLMFG